MIKGQSLLVLMAVHALHVGCGECENKVCFCKLSNWHSLFLSSIDTLWSITNLRVQVWGLFYKLSNWHSLFISVLNTLQTITNWCVQVSSSIHRHSFYIHLEIIHIHIHLNTLPAITNLRVQVSSSIHRHSFYIHLETIHVHIHLETITTIAWKIMSTITKPH